MSINSRRRSSMMKHSGALMSSRLMPPNDGPRNFTALMNSSGSSVSTSRSIESTSAKRLNRTALPSITGLEASAPRLPRPRIAVPLEMTATMLPLVGVVVGRRGIGGDRLHRHGDAGRIGERQIALRRHRLGGDDLQLAGPPARVEQQRFLIGDGIALRAGRPGAWPSCFKSKRARSGRAGRARS